MRAKHQSHNQPQGFSLVVTVAMMVLLTLIAIGLLSMASIAARSTSINSAQLQAETNARMALMMAINELQLHMGPDQRISARAEILDTDPTTEDVDGVENPNFLGVWDSWDTWLNEDKESLSIQDTYQPGRHPSLFRRWLVSHPDASDFNAALDAAPTADAIALVGEGTAGVNSERHVRVSPVPIIENGQVAGRYAWWVSDESLKARLNHNQRPDAGSFEQAQTVSGQLGRPGVERMAQMGALDLNPDSIGKMITLNQAGISAGQDAVREHFHDITTYSMGLHTDVRWGGFKRDLNLAFESEEIPVEMNQASLYGGRPFDAPIRPMNGELANIVPSNPYVAPMSWRQMREYYRLYRDFSGDGKMNPIEWQSGEPLASRFIMGNGRRDWEVAGYARHPIMLKQTWVIATSCANNGQSPDGVAYYILAVPIVYWWNPYNVPLKINSGEFSSMGSLSISMNIAHKLYRDNTLIQETPLPFIASDRERWGAAYRTYYGRMNNQNAGMRNSNLGYRMVVTNDPIDAPIVFQPGEVRVFSTDNGIAFRGGPGQGVENRRFGTSPGYTPVEDSLRLQRGLRYWVDPGPGPGVPSVSLKFYSNWSGGLGGVVSGPTHQGRYYGSSERSALSHIMHGFESTEGAYYPDGNLVDSNVDLDSPDIFAARVSTISSEWMNATEHASAELVKDDPASRARWGPPGSPPLVIGMFSITAKSPERLLFDGTGGYTGDYRNRTWLHSPPTGLGSFLYNPVDLNRADSPYQIHFRPVNGDQELSQYLQADGPLGYFGGGFSAASGQHHFAPHALPAAPLMNLGSLSGMRVDSARSRITQENDAFSNPTVDRSEVDGAFQSFFKLKHLAHAGGAVGVGVGNSHAHPMIEPEEVYTLHNFGIDPGWDGQSGVQGTRRSTKMGVCDDYWDHLFLANEELWDSWFCSGITPEMSNGNVAASARTSAENFFAGESSTVPSHHLPYLQGNSPGELADKSQVNDSTSDANGWDTIGAHILNIGQFNVNSTSKEAWKAMLMSMADRPIALNGDDSGPGVVARDENAVTLSRHLIANGDSSATGPNDENAWKGIRQLNEDQIDKLAEEMVRQVKLRGPFLNMSDFINRRLNDDALGVTGALQAAIDWDEFNAGFDGTTSGSGESINAGYKTGGAMIRENALPANYPNPKAASGSRYAGIPGYVMQSDILQGIGGSLSVRGDTFLVRAYGESLTADGSVAARAWCEAVVQRKPEYVDPADSSDTRMPSSSEQLAGAALPINPTNQRFGRKFEIVSFRWLNKNEI